jgi:hypothetical protein
MNFVFPAILSLSFLFLISISYVIFLHLKIRKMLTGRNAFSLEDQIVSDRKTMTLLQNKNLEIDKKLEILERKSKESIRNVEMLRFNPFEEQGSNQSFSASLINENGEGLILSSLYGRDRVSFFAKPVSLFKSSYELSDEEKTVLEKTKQKNAK